MSFWWCWQGFFSWRCPTEKTQKQPRNPPPRKQTGLVQQVNPPTYLGAVIVCQGADSASVRLAIVEAVGSVTGLSTDKITVLKMK